MPISGPEPFTAEWALDNQEQRIRHVTSVDIPRLKAFYDAMLSRMDAVIDHLNAFPLDDMPPPEARLMKLALTVAESAHPIDLEWKRTYIESPFPAERLKMVGPSLQW